MEHDTQTVLFGHRHDFGGSKPFGLGVSERRQHLYLIGQTGTGKSTLIRNAIFQDIEAGRGVGVIDPHGDLAQEIIDHIPPSRTDDVVYFDPSAPDALSINLFKATGDNWHIVASGIVSAFKKIWGDSWGARLEYILYATVAALLQCENTSLLGVSRMLSDDRYRAWVLRQVKDPMVRSFWLNEFENYNRAFRQEAVSPVQNKVGQLFLAPMLRNVLGQVGSKINFRFMMDDARIFVANLSKGALARRMRACSVRSLSLDLNWPPCPVLICLRVNGEASSCMRMNSSIAPQIRLRVSSLRPANTGCFSPSLTSMWGNWGTKSVMRSLAMSAPSSHFA